MVAAVNSVGKSTFTSELSIMAARVPGPISVYLIDTPNTDPS